jgi:hypothetical protein
MSFVPRFTLRSANNSTEIYVFSAVQSTNLPQTPRETVSISNLRSKGSVVIDGGIKSFEAVIEFVLWSNTGEYEDIIALIETLETTIPINTAFILRMDKTSTTYYDYKVKRLVPFNYTDVGTDQRLYRQKVIATFLCDAF